MSVNGGDRRPRLGLLLSVLSPPRASSILCVLLTSRPPSPGLTFAFRGTRTYPSAYRVSPNGPLERRIRSLRVVAHSTLSSLSHVRNAPEFPGQLRRGHS